MEDRPSRILRRSAALLSVVLFAGCGGPSPSSPLATGSSGATGGPGAGTPRPATSPIASPASGLPEPTLTDPVEIGAALWDPAGVEQGVVSLIEQLGIDIFTVEGELVRDAAAEGPPGMWLFEAEVRGLVEMGLADASAIAEGRVPFTLDDLYEGLRDVYPELSQEQLLDAYIQAYKAVPGDLVRESFAGHPFVPGAAFTRVHLWLFVLDGVVGRPQPATSRTVAWSGAVQAARGPVAQVQLPPPSAALAQAMLVDLTALPVALAHMGLVAHMLPVDFRLSPSNVHEGHGGPGQPATLVFKSQFVPVPITSPYTGLPILIPNQQGLQGLPVSFQSPQEATLRAHGSFSGGIGAPGTLPGSLGIPVMTDVLGEINFTYTPRTEPADGQGDLAADVAVVQAVIDLQQVVTYMYTAAGGAALALGIRVIPVPLVIEWHEATLPTPSTPGRWVVDLTGPKPGAGHYEGVADSLCARPGGGAMWTATLIPTGSAVTMIDLTSASGFDAVSVSTAPSSDFDGLWFFRSDSPNTFAEVIGDDTTDPPTVRGTARYTDTEGRVYTAAVTVHCAQTFQ